MSTILYMVWYLLYIFYINFPHYALNHYEDPPVKIISNYENHGEELILLFPQTEFLIY